MITPRVTLSQIAARAGVHITTVSLALRNSPRLPAATRERIHALAKEMNYRPDPMLSSLIAYGAIRRKPVFQATIALFNAFPKPEEMVANPCFRGYLEGAVKRAETLGYKIEEVCLGAKDLKPEALKRQLLARGITSLLIFPLPQQGTLLPGFDWEAFNVVALGYSLTEPQFTRVTNHQFRSMILMIRELRRLGYRRIGLCLDEIYNRKINMGLSSAYYAYTESIPEEDRVPVHRLSEGTGPQAIMTWVRRAEPEVIVGIDEGLFSWVREAGLRVPEDIGLVSAHVYEEDGRSSGMLQNDDLIGAMAVDSLVAMIQRNEKGCPQHPQHVLIDGTWREGQTVRRVGPEQPWFLKLPSLV